MSPRRTPLSETELEVLKALWDQGSGTVRSLNDVLAQRGRQWAYTTVLTLLGRLEQKGYVASDKRGVAHVFRPRVSRDHLLRDRLADMAQELCEGAATPLVNALVHNHKFSAAEIKYFRKLLDEMDPAIAPPLPPRSGPRRKT